MASMLVAMFAAVQPASAQRLAGEVVDGSTGAAVAGAVVTLSDTAGEVLRRAVTEEAGTFLFENVQPALLTLSVEAFGFTTDHDEQVDFDGQPLFLRITVSPAPVPTEGVAVSVTRQRPHLRANGFYDRLRRGHGDFVTEEQIERLAPVRSSELLRRVNSIKLLRGEPILRRGGAGFRQNFNCVPTIWVDGVLVRDNNRISGPRSIRAFNNLLPAHQNIRAIEVYSGNAGTPSQYAGSNAACGVIVVWLKH